jgi:hypothetical protein
MKTVKRWQGRTIENFDTLRRKKPRGAKARTQKSSSGTVTGDRARSRISFVRWLNPDIRFPETDEIERLYHRGESEERTLIMVKPGRINDKRISK